MYIYIKKSLASTHLNTNRVLVRAADIGTCLCQQSEGQLAANVACNQTLGDAEADGTDTGVEVGGELGGTLEEQGDRAGVERLQKLIRHSLGTVSDEGKG